MPSASSNHPLCRIAAILNRHAVEYLVIGGQAEALMGSPRVTVDVDVCYRRTPENLERLAAALQDLGVSLRGAPEGIPFRPDTRTLHSGLNFTFNSSFGPVDFLGEVEPLGDFDSVATHAEIYELWGMRFRTIGLD